MARLYRVFSKFQPVFCEDLLADKSKTPEQVRSLGVDNGIRVFEPLAITGSQPIEKISTHSYHQKSHSFSNYSQSQYILISSFSSILGESKFDARVLVKTLYFLKCFHNGIICQLVIP